MFDFLFGRSANKRKAPHSPDAGPGFSQQKTDEIARQEALSRAEQFSGDEPAAIAFILECQFADARLKAAEHVRCRQALEQVRSAMLNIDRRVTKLMQTRLETIQKLENQEKNANLFIATAQRLAQEPHLTPNLAADLDRQWQSLGAVAAPLQQAFDSVRQEIGFRLAAQTSLQRTVRDALAKVRQVSSSSDSMTPAELGEMLDRLTEVIGECVSSRELFSLPKNLLATYEQEFTRLKQLQSAHAQSHQWRLERQQALAIWEAEPVATLDRKAMERQWKNMPPLEEADMAPFKARFDALLQQISECDRAQQKDPFIEIGAEKPQFSELLNKMERALQEGSLQAAVEHDAKLRTLALKAAQPDAAQTERLNQARSELNRLQDWAKWSGRVSREELLKSVEELPARSLPLDELASRVAEARKTWKLLDSASGAAPRIQWQQFDAACNLAYAPVAERSRKLADERAQKTAAAQAIIDKVREFAAGANLDSSDAGGADWKNIASFFRHTQQSWRQLGPIDRKEKKRLDADFDHAMQMLQKPLRQQWQAESMRRERIIDEVCAIDPRDRTAADTIRQLQERWQESARALPLGNKEEQELWRRFRTACDSLFALRKEASDAAGEERRKNLRAKEAVCSMLEAALDDPAEGLAAVLRDTTAEWNGIGPVPNADDRAVHERYRAAVSSVQARLDIAGSEEKQANYQALCEKLALCQAAEAAVVGNVDPNEASWNLHWMVLPPLAGRQESMLRARFDAAINAMNLSDSLYASMLQANNAMLRQELLRLEIIFGLESPAELSADRMKMQIEVLQNSLGGNKEEARSARLDILCSLPAFADEQTAMRMAELLQKTGGS
jgi:hypothetical protein